MYEGEIVSVELDGRQRPVVRISNGDRGSFFWVTEARELYRELGEALAEIDDGL